MGVDYNTLSTWMTPDLMFRDNMLMGRTRVMGMSQTAAIIHVVAFVCTSGTSLPFNVAFGIWHRHRYRQVKMERKWIRQILGTRNVVYQGRGHWVNTNPNPNAAQCVYNNPRAGHFVQGTQSAGHWGRVIPSGGHWMEPTPGIGQTVNVTPTQHADHMQFVQDAANDLQQDFGNNNNDCNQQASGAYDQSFYNF